MPLDLIAFDLDGTILNSRHKISEKNYSVLRIAHKQGIKLIPCTGRAIFEFPNELNQLVDEFDYLVFPYLITSNGAQVFDFPQKKLLYSRSIPKEEALSILINNRKQLILNYGSFGIQGATDNQGHVWESEKAKSHIKKYKEEWDIPLANLEDLIEWNEGLIKFSLNFIFEDDLKKCYDEYSKWPSLTLSSSWPLNIEIMSSGVSKGEALNFVSGQMNIPMERIMAIGDNLNDMEMIQQSGFGVAMGNAIPELKEKALWITASNDEDGFALAVEKMLAEL
ncbi:MAG: Cof-type HAD-IIB family hydrolase [Treponema sp.]|jgi:Cof subfamily protein (haloacid dehalogenase superfamily)|nr:Cof-type HAD-IIB family hydrolase [Treponema sp.]